MTDIYVPSKSHLFILRFHSSASSSLVTFSQFVTPPPHLGRLLWFFFAPKSGVLLGTACQESLDFAIVVVLSLCFWYQCAKTVGNLEAQCYLDISVVVCRRIQSVDFFWARWRGVDDYFILVELHGTSDLISTLMMHLVSRNGSLEHLATMSCTLLRSWVKWLSGTSGYSILYLSEILGEFRVLAKALRTYHFHSRHGDFYRNPNPQHPS